MEKSNILKPCPCCGGAPEYHESTSAVGLIRRCIKIICRDCGLQTRNEYENIEYSAKDKVTEIWNNRIVDTNVLIKED